MSTLTYRLFKKFAPDHTSKVEESEFEYKPVGLQTLSPNSRNQETFLSVKKKVNILGFAGHLVSTITILVYHCRMKAAISNM